MQFCRSGRWLCHTHEQYPCVVCLVTVPSNVEQNCVSYMYRSLSHRTSLEYKKWYMLWPTRWRGYLLSQQTCLAPSITSLWPFALLLWTGSAAVACVWNQVSCCCCVCLIVCSTVAHILTNAMGNVSYSQVPQRWLQPTLWRHSCQSEHLTMFRRSHEIVRFNS